VAATKRNIHEFYETLEIELSATAEEIKKAYQKLANKYHPDKCKDDDAHDKFIAIRQAYELIVEFIKKNPGFHHEHVAEQANFRDETSTEEGEKTDYKKFFDIFFDEFARNVFTKTTSNWASILQNANVEKIAIYRQFLNKLHDGPDYENENKTAVEWIIWKKARLGAQMSARTKVVKRTMICEILNYINGFDKITLSKEIKSAATEVGFHIDEVFEFDITPTLGKHFSSSIIGHGLDSRVLNKLLGTPGRTAANKTKTTLEDMSDFINVTQIMYAIVSQKMAILMDELREEYSEATNSEKSFRAKRKRV
jgi:hypothetical protein